MTKSSAHDDQDDWASVTDPKAKKRIQNRLAQRQYRQRAKDRLADLEARLSSIEGGQQMSKQGNTDNPVLESPFVVPDMDNNTSSNQCIFSLPPCPQNAHSVCDSSHDLQQQQTLSQQEGQTHQSLSQAAIRTQAVLPKSSTTSESHTVDDSDDTLQRLLGTGLANWDDHQFASTTPLPASGSFIERSTNGTGPPSFGTLETEAMNITTGNLRLDDRMECIMECVGAANFGSFDAMATAYYVGEFEHQSQLSDEQHISRRRRLRDVIAEIFRLSGSWSPSERSGLHDEILKAAEILLTSETNKSWGTAGLSMDVESLGSIEMMTASQALSTTKRVFQDKLPNLWAFMMSLSASDRPAWQRDTSHIALAAILLLRFGGRIDNEKLLVMIRHCL